jgi:hypothetical protein
MAADLLARVCAEIEGRLAELRPAVAEYEELIEAADSLGPASGSASTASARSATRARPAIKAKAPRAAREAAQPHAAKEAQPSAARGAAQPRAARKPRLGAVELAILAALEHGSHTLAELGVVTAMSTPALREGLRQLLAGGKITRTSREGRAAYALSDSA